ncbi:MAG: hypothetical protein VR78_11650 [Hoeflea sp. BRH_c9]|nr:MAG: hypothetical protein VR78_11650 [Hoeflea sp. BRH_c9]
MDFLANAALDIDRKQHRAVIGEADVLRFTASALLQLTAFAFAIALTAQTATHVGQSRSHGEQREGAGTTTTIESVR